jgi:phosphate starvation-inducible membrane PsiE
VHHTLSLTHLILSNIHLCRSITQSPHYRTRFPSIMGSPHSILAMCLSFVGFALSYFTSFTVEWRCVTDANFLSNSTKCSSKASDRSVFRHSPLFHLPKKLGLRFVLYNILDRLVVWFIFGEVIKVIRPPLVIMHLCVSPVED